MMEERQALEFGTTLENLQVRHSAIARNNFPDLHVPTGSILRLAQSIVLPGPEGLKALMKAAKARLTLRPVTREIAEQLYLRRTADEILTSGKVATHKASGIHGCQDHALVVMALLRAKQIPESDFEFVRLLPRPLEKDQPRQANHSIVLVSFGPKRFKIDLSRPNPVIPISDAKIRDLKKHAFCGRDSFDVGITSAANAFARGKGWTTEPGSKGSK